MVCPHSMSDLGLWPSKVPGFFILTKFTQSRVSGGTTVGSRYQLGGLILKSASIFCKMGWQLSHWKLKLRFLFAVFCLLVQNSAQVATWANHPTLLVFFWPCLFGRFQTTWITTVWTQGCTSTGLRQRLTQINLKTLHYPRQWNKCIMKHVCLQQDQSKVYLTQDETNINYGLDQDFSFNQKCKIPILKGKHIQVSQVLTNTSAICKPDTHTVN